MSYRNLHPAATGALALSLGLALMLSTASTHTASAANAGNTANTANTANSASAAGAIAGGAATPVPTGPAQFAVEILVFEHSVAGASENWAAEPAGRGYGSPANRGGATPRVVRILPASSYHLDGAAQSLISHGLGRPVAHAAWIQTAANWGTHTGISLPSVGINLPGLKGMIYLERAPQFLHLGFDVSLKNGETYFINEMHSARFEERQYFDHPAFGIIAVITRA